MNEEIREIQKKYCSRSMVLAIVAGFILIAAGYGSVGKGLVLGTLFSSINFALMGELLPRRLGKTRGKSSIFSGVSVVGRYLLLAAPLVVGIKYPSKFNLCAVIVGIFMVQLMILVDHLRSAILLTRRKKI